jgi:hypothetical protein
LSFSSIGFEEDKQLYCLLSERPSFKCSLFPAQERFAIAYRVDLNFFPSWIVDKVWDAFAPFGRLSHEFLISASENRNFHSGAA